MAQTCLGVRPEKFLRATSGGPCCHEPLLGEATVHTCPPCVCGHQGRHHCLTPFLPVPGGPETGHQEPALPRPGGAVRVCASICQQGGRAAGWCRLQDPEQSQAALLPEEEGEGQSGAQQGPPRGPSGAGCRRRQCPQWGRPAGPASALLPRYAVPAGGLPEGHTRGLCLGVSTLSQVRLGQAGCPSGPCAPPQDRALLLSGVSKRKGSSGRLAQSPFQKTRRGDHQVAHGVFMELAKDCQL